jgi:microsomal dipeptidase-like Zn-dependent dipeptidase
VPENSRDRRSRDPRGRRPARTRLLWSSSLAVAGLVCATTMVPSYGGDGDGESKALLRAYERATAQRAADAAGDPDPAGDAAGEAAGDAAHLHAPGPGADGHDHDHADPETKNDLSRSADGEDPAATADPTTPEQARRAVAAVAAQRAEPDPQLTRIPKPPARTAVPRTRYAMAGGCYALRAPDGRWVRRAGSSYAATAERRGRAERFHFQATTLGRYLLFDSQERFLARGSTPLSPGVAAAGSPSGNAVWTVRRPGQRFTFSGGGSGLAAEPRLTTGDRPDRFALRLVDGCARWPEITTNIKGRTFAGVSSFQEVRGTTDAHTHQMAFEFLGGAAHCGRPWSPYGVTVALVDCPDHEGQGIGAALENLTRTGSPVGTHDPVGWPTFKDWPAPDSLTHEGTYHAWMKRAWQGGVRLFVNLLVENNQLCTIYPVKGPNWPETRCDDMKSIALQAKRMKQFQRYVDAQHGGPGQGWYRIVRNPFQARKVINAGKMAVVMGIETSVPFGCSTALGNIPQCSAAEITRQIGEVHKMGVRQMELVNKFDNALSGVAGDQGEIGVLVNGANFLETGSFWDMRTCPTEYGEGVEDKEQYAAPDDGGAFGQRDGLFGAVMEVSGLSVPALPLYGPAPHCNNRDLTTLGEHTIREMVKRSMIFDPDHMSVKARRSSLDLLEELGYSGVISSHSWSTPDAYPRIYRLGGVVMPYAGDSTGFVDKWERHLTWADPRFYFGFGFGADINGLGAQGDPRGADAARPVTYPFTGMGGVRVHKQRSGQRVYDINVDGVAHYGLYPDWLEDLRRLGGNAIAHDMSRGAEAYLQMWERAVGVTNDACRQPSKAAGVGLFRSLKRGLTVKQVLLRAGQPHQRLGRELTYCARKANGSLTRVTLRFTGAGRLR